MRGLASRVYANLAALRAVVGTMRNRTQRRLDDIPTPNLTPMIDVVFNLIIFFMVITDMTQQDLEFLVVPESSARPDVVVDDDPETIIINVVNAESEAVRQREQAGTFDPDRPPIFLKGRQIRDLEDLRARVYVLANPRIYPDLTQDEIAPGLRPSRKAVLIRCDQLQIFGWVQGIMQMLGPRPGEDGSAAFDGCPMVRKVEIAVRDPDAER